MSACQSRKLKQKRRYQRTQVTITSGSNFRFQNNRGRHDLIGLRYQIPCCNTFLQPRPVVFDGMKVYLGEFARSTCTPTGGHTGMGGSGVKRMRLTGLLILCAAAASAADCDRVCLKNMMTTYLNALVAQDPSKAPLASNVRFTEDSKDLQVAEGFWKTATKLGDYRQDYIDVKEQVVASHVTMEESGKRALFTARLKVVGGKITEIETLVTHAGERTATSTANMVVRPDMGIEPPAGQKNKREELIRIADYYPRGLAAGGFDKVDTPFAKDAFRIENGFVMAGEGCGAAVRVAARPRLRPTALVRLARKRPRMSAVA
jgi:hypothetical protein